MKKGVIVDLSRHMPCLLARSLAVVPATTGSLNVIYNVALYVLCCLLSVTDL